jgi:transcriptional regulator with XRE-family HTH domain
MAEKGFFKGIAERMKIVRRQLGFSSSEMARRLGVSVTAYYKNEGNVTEPSDQSLKRMAEEFDISLDWFLLNRGPMYFKKERERVKALEQDLQKVQEELKAMEEGTADAAGIRNRPEIKELLEHMEREPLLYHEILAHLHRFLKTPMAGDKA